MKKRLFHSLFCIFSHLSDRTNGAPFIVKYKLIIGTLIIGLASSCNGDKNRQEGEKEVVSKPIDTTQITCYEAIAPDNSVASAASVKTKKRQIERFEPPYMPDSIVVSVTCYMPSMDALNHVDENIEKIKDSME